MTALPTSTHCPYCALQCAMTLTPTPADRVPVEVSGREFPTNRGGLCKKGWTAAELLARSDRITAPLLKQDDGSFAETSWEEALDRIAAGVRRFTAESGTDAIGVFGGGGLTNEKAYQLGKFARIALRTRLIDYNGRFCMSSAAAAANRAFGVDRGLPFPLADLDTADTLFVLGSNMGDTMPPFVQHMQGARASGGLIVVDPRRSTTARLTADGAGTHVQPVPGTDLALLLGMTHVVIVEELYDRSYVDTRTTGFEALRRSVSSWWPARTESVTGVPADTVRDLARRLAGSSSAYILTGRGVEQHVDGTDTATAAINLALLLGLVGRPGSGYGTLTGQGNGQGGREHGQKSDQLPGYRKITDPAARAHVAAVWGVPADTIPGPGLPAVELLARCGVDEGVRMLLVHGSNVVVSAPDVSQVRAALGRLDLLIVSDFFLSETAQLADIVLPVLQWAEEEGTMTNLEGRVLRRRRALLPPPGARSELWIMRELAARLDAPGVWSTDPAEVFDELARASEGGLADYSGLSHALLDTGIAAHWPYPSGSTGTPRLFEERFAHDDGRARLVSVRARAPESPRGAELSLITGRILTHYQSGTQTRRVTELNGPHPRLVAQLHPLTARDRGVAAGTRVRVANGRGAVEADVELSDDIRPDTVFLPFHYAGAESANLLTSSATDPLSSMPEFKHAVVTVDAIPAGAE
ncbi:MULTISPECIES: molybdopterin oxidoreductase family protein [unclassified Microbacterium]|uniref:molybdopterin oxidoreductase family protein n=1 Tax=unclassified Microbacterium TaxID=2609290 RepID=UPI000EA9229C|nr:MULTISPECIES: molybdopterin oxidoreductase family protein [unclassified Microbacterium]MBT2483304.1 molybdopterin oxidoreductase family protein [Microbacterium sp. ISL-108]RKN66342.1 nitrite reductase [Microbacterium sp. CGR2]